MTSFTYGAMGRAGKVLAALIFALFVFAGPVMAGAVKLVAFGDSLTAGYGLAQGAGFVPQLRAWLAAKGEAVELVQAGVSGDTTAGGLARLDWALGEDVQGIILELGANDALRGLPPEEARANLRRMLEICHEKGIAVLLVGVPVAGNFGPRYQTQFTAIWPDLAEQFDTLYYPDFFAGLGKTPSEALPLMQADGIHPNAKGVKLIVARIGPSVQALIQRIEARAGGDFSAKNRWE
ncbi:arylesterase [Aquicoccus sp. G2-2]|uniref:arylesterase n=1 Tax=Aquicoccus sp. G2-2 TaxID=3092120 RepID=UPI002ADFEBD4|nr:arylesterase [Aquicoccus sp. G2-2]MEA1112677.1 arylesterase [Aquicoccus sp. G2-2]